MSHVSYGMSHVPYGMSHVSYAMSHVPYWDVSYLVSHVAYNCVMNISECVLLHTNELCQYSVSIDIYVYTHIHRYACVCMCICECVCPWRGHKINTTPRCESCHIYMSHMTLINASCLYKFNDESNTSPWVMSQTATHCNILQHTATHCNTLQHVTYTRHVTYEQSHVTYHEVMSHIND